MPIAAGHPSRSKSKRAATSTVKMILRAICAELRLNWGAGRAAFQKSHPEVHQRSGLHDLGVCLKVFA